MRSEPPAMDEEFTMMGQAPDTGLQKLRDEFSAENLATMRKLLGQSQLEHVTPALKGFNFRGFVRNLRGMGKLEFAETKLYLLLTRNNAFVLSNLIAEELHDLVKGFMDLKLSDRVSLLDHNHRRRFLYRVPSQQLELLRTLANQNRYLTARGFPFKDLEQLKQRLAVCTVDFGTFDGQPTPLTTFDVREFASSIRFVSNVYEDGEENPYHSLVVGDQEVVYMLFVQPATPIPGSIRLMFGSTPLALVRE